VRISELCLSNDIFHLLLIALNLDHFAFVTDIVVDSIVAHLDI
jgi:hypothetical protein